MSRMIRGKIRRSYDKILEIKDKIMKFVANYEIYAKMVAKFIVAFSLFLTINTCIGFMEKSATYQ